MFTIRSESPVAIVAVKKSISKAMVKKAMKSNVVMVKKAMKANVLMVKKAVKVNVVRARVTKAMKKGGKKARKANLKAPA